MSELTPGIDPEENRQRPPARAAAAAVQAVLSNDHERLELLFQSIVAEAAREDPHVVRAAWRVFEGELLHHFEDEELHILPAFAQQRPSEARAILAEHEQIRATLTGIGVDMDLHRLSRERVADFVASLRAHARHEDDLLYPWAAHQLGDAAGDRVRRTLSASVKAPVRGSEWHIDPERSTLHFSLRHIVVQEIRGQFRRWGGTITLDGEVLARSSVRLWVDLASVDTDDPGRDDQIRSPEFFDVGAFPQATFSGTGVQLTEHANPIVTGRLELHGFIGEVEVEVTRHDRWNEAKGLERVSYEAKARLDRQKFGLRWNQDLDVGGVVVGDEIEIVAQLEAARRPLAP
jgi:polyisoprenoid-binding protein YceI/hemerythrin superfamily protein